jgi:DNA-binding transcriptional MerR regulator
MLPSLPPLDVYVNVNQAGTMSPTASAGSRAKLVPRAKERTWSVRELADELGVTTRTLRFYEAEGLLAPSRIGSTRIFGPRDHARLVLIQRGKRFGMSLPEIAEIIDLYDDAASGERAQLALMVPRLAEIAADLRARRRDLTRILAEVDDVAAECRRRLAELAGLTESSGS